MYGLNNVSQFREQLPINSVSVRIDRATVLGNPFVMNCESERNAVCEAYDEWLRLNVESTHPTVVNVYKVAQKYGVKVQVRRKVVNSLKVQQELNRILKLLSSGQTVVLNCWCAPKRCHGDSVKELLTQKGFLNVKVASMR